VVCVHQDAQGAYAAGDACSDGSSGDAGIAAGSADHAMEHTARIAAIRSLGSRRVRVTIVPRRTSSRGTIVLYGYRQVPRAQRRGTRLGAGATTGKPVTFTVRLPTAGRWVFSARFAGDVTNPRAVTVR